MGFSRIEVVTSMNKLSDLKTALSKLGVSGMTVIQAIGCGVEKGTFEYAAEQNKEMELLPKQLIMIVVEDSLIDKVVETVKKELYTGHIGDGKIFISPLCEHHPRANRNALAKGASGMSRSCKMNKI